MPTPVSRELLDVVDPATSRVSGQRSRAEVHLEGLWHGVFHCLVVRPSAGTVVLQRRAAAKIAFPDQLDLTATGHLGAGEKPADGIRELTEELGIEVAPTALVPLGQRLLADDQGEGRNCEIVHLFFLADDRPLDAYRPAPAEVSGLVELTSDGLLDLLADRLPTVPAHEWSVEGGHADIAVARNDLVVETSGYWVVVAVMAHRYLIGETPIAI